MDNESKCDDCGGLLLELETNMMYRCDNCGQVFVNPKRPACENFQRKDSQ